MSRYAIIDLANIFHRCHFVTQGNAYDRGGMALSIVFRSLRKLHRDMKADHMVFCCEARSWRYDVYPEYKASRKVSKLSQTKKEKEEMEVFYKVMEDFQNYISEKTKCTILQSNGVEGDDFVARWTQLHPNDEHIILSGDSDFVQLLAPNVSIYDGVNNRHITMNGITNEKGQSLEFAVDAAKGKIKVGKLAASDWVPETDWWKKALFIKIIRGDVGDGIFSAYPGVRFEGSSKKTGIREAWEDRHTRGFGWNNLMLQRWEKLTGVDNTGNNIVKEVRVIDEFKFNEMLIDLTKQPQNIIDLMDEVIVQAVQKEEIPSSKIGIGFLKFCEAQFMPALSKEANDHTIYLNAPYRK